MLIFYPKRGVGSSCLNSRAATTHHGPLPRRVSERLCLRTHYLLQYLAGVNVYSRAYVLHYQFHLLFCCTSLPRFSWIFRLSLHFAPPRPLRWDTGACIFLKRIILKPEHLSITVKLSQKIPRIVWHDEGWCRVKSNRARQQQNGPLQLTRMASWLNWMLTVRVSLSSGLHLCLPHCIYHAY